MPRGGTGIAVRRFEGVSVTRRSVVRFVLPIASLAALVFGLAAIDQRVREQVSVMIEQRGPSVDVVSAGSHAHQLLFVFTQAVKDQSMEHAPLVMFATVAVVLLLLMLKS